MIQQRPFDYTHAERGLRGPRHRWETAQELLPCRPDRLAPETDDMVRAAHHFQQLAKQGSDGAKQAQEKYPHIAAALLLEADPSKLEKSKVGTLGDLPAAEIARRVGGDESAVKAWESLFYDVRACRDALGWIVTHVINKEIAAGRSELAAKLKMVAAVGPVGAHAILDAGSRVPVTAGEHLFQRKLKLHLKYDQAMGMTEGPDSQFRFVRLYTNLKIQQMRLKVEEAKLGERCNAALRKHELAKVRSAAALERAKCRAVREARKAEDLALRKEGVRHARELAAARLRAFDLAEEEAAAARAADSPLNRLTWAQETHPTLGEQGRPRPVPNTRMVKPVEMLPAGSLWEDWAVDGAPVAVTV